MADTPMGKPMPDGIGPDVRLIIDTEAGHVLDLTLIESALRARASGGALVPFLYRDPYDPENPGAPRPLRRAVLAIVDDKEVKSVDGPGCTPARAYVEHDQEQTDPAEFVRCGRCHAPFDPADTRWDGKAQYHQKPQCRECTDRCHDTEIADHRCIICDPGPRNIPVRSKVNGKWASVLLNRLEWEASHAAASR